MKEYWNLIKNNRKEWFSLESLAIRQGIAIHQTIRSLRILREHGPLAIPWVPPNGISVYIAPFSLSKVLEMGSWESREEPGGMQSRLVNLEALLPLLPPGLTSGSSFGSLASNPSSEI